MSSSRPSQRRVQFSFAQQRRREIGSAAAKHGVERALEQAAAVEPVMVVAEAADAVFSCERRLRRSGSGSAGRSSRGQRGTCGWTVAEKCGRALDDVRPFGETLAPPGIVLRNGMELREVESDQSHVGTGSGELQGPRARVRR